MAHDHTKCGDVFALLSEYLDVELPPEACAQIREHVEGCAPCVEFAESLKRTVELCKEYEPETMPKPVSAAAKAQLMAAWRKTSGRV